MIETGSISATELTGSVNRYYRIVNQQFAACLIEPGLNLDNAAL
jgi:hypothetical protein